MKPNEKIALGLIVLLSLSVIAMLGERATQSLAATLSASPGASTTLAPVIPTPASLPAAQPLPAPRCFAPWVLVPEESGTSGCAERLPALRSA